MITSHFAVRKRKGESTCMDNSSDFILEGDELKRGQTSRGESVINPKFKLFILILNTRNYKFNLLTYVYKFNLHTHD